MDWNKVKPELQKKLDPKHVKPAPRGKFGSYVDGHHVITEANRIFGEDGWSYAINEMRMVSEQTVSLEGQNGPYEQYRVGYLARVSVRVADTYREGVAVGSGVGSPQTMADHHESAAKEAETDALKRALRTYGNTFGLALYDKTGADVGVDPVEPTQAEIDTAVANIKAIETMESLATHWKMLNKNVPHVVAHVDVISAKDDLKAKLAAELVNHGAG